MFNGFKWEYWRLHDCLRRILHFGQQLLLRDGHFGPFRRSAFRLTSRHTLQLRLRRMFVVYIKPCSLHAVSDIPVSLVLIREVQRMLLSDRFRRKRRLYFRRSVIRNHLCHDQRLRLHIRFTKRVFDDSLEAKAVNFLESVKPKDRQSADAFLESLVPFSGDSQRDFIQCIVVLLSSASHTITRTAMKLLEALIRNCSIKVQISLVKADLIPQLINTLNPHSHSFSEAVDSHINLIASISNSLSLTTPYCLAQLQIEVDGEEYAVHEMILRQVVTPSEKAGQAAPGRLTSMSAREGKKSEKERRETEAAKRRKSTTPLLHISPPVSATADEARPRFRRSRRRHRISSSLPPSPHSSPNPPQPHSREGRDYCWLT
ncbi:hypothetical protein BLNAU_11728 [Blattamonas nauphoetae]|uniref:Uncharacterized protein n=1 Tax=Blattamonas nauphoetae TaxID=2049346 RepID=A0ABQ9XPZ3_9EUKA|nr:hypothetical protein BLNAU_11728 [Blattamonas nauphoetae]